MCVFALSVIGTVTDARDQTKAHRNKGPRKDFLSGEFKRAQEVKHYLEDSLVSEVPEDQAAQHDMELKRAVKDLDVAFKRMS